MHKNKRWHCSWATCLKRSAFERATARAIWMWSNLAGADFHAMPVHSFWWNILPTVVLHKSIIDQLPYTFQRVGKDTMEGFVWLCPTQPAEMRRHRKLAHKPLHKLHHVGVLAGAWLAQLTSAWLAKTHRNFPSASMAQKLLSCT